MCIRDRYYAIPYGDKTAENGRWRTGPGYALFAAVKKELGSPRIIAEDLGFLTDDVRALLKECAYPGMNCLLYTSDAADERSSVELYCLHWHP